MCPRSHHLAPGDVGVPGLEQCPAIADERHMLARAPHDGAADIDLLHTGREHPAPVVELAQQEFDPAEGARGVPRDHLWAKTVRLFRPAPSVSLAQCSNGFGPRSCQGNCTGITRWPSLPSPPKSADALITFSSTSTRTPTGSGPRSCWRCVQTGPGSPSSATTRSRSIRFAPRPCAYPRLSAQRFAAGRGLRARTQLSINAADPRCRHPALGREPARCGGGLQGHPASTRRRPGNRAQRHRPALARGLCRHGAHPVYAACRRRTVGRGFAA
jgi:hypothetical protein